MLENKAGRATAYGGFLDFRAGVDAQTVRTVAVNKSDGGSLRLTGHGELVACERWNSFSTTIRGTYHIII